MRPLLGTLVEIRAGGPESRVNDGIAAAFAAIERVQRLMSFHDAGSDVSRINAAPVGREVAVDRETYCVLRYALDLRERSDGAFDLTIAPSLVAAGFLPYPRLAAAQVDSARFGDLELLPARAVRWRKKGWIDLGGIAKGYAVDVAVAALRSQGMTHGLVNAGGDLRGFGERPWPIQIRAPEQPTMLLNAGSLRDAAIATSAGYFRNAHAGSTMVAPIVDPAHRRCVLWNASISVVASRCMTADALTKVVRLAPAALPALLDHYDAQTVIVDANGARFCGRDWLQ
ncbi:MAG TPA: FAD:protein FMN transferase [Steroidobacteraceae bacterium]|nr:FAD:protein FMN transferase [Steroidobacteraceae bacterium]